MREYVLVQKGQIPVYPQNAADLVREQGFGKTAKRYGVGESTLRKFLNDAGFRFNRKTSWQVVGPGLEEESGDGVDVQAAGAGPAEPAGTPGGPGGVEADGVQSGHQPVGVGAESPE